MVASLNSRIESKEEEERVEWESEVSIQPSVPLDELARMRSFPPPGGCSV